MSSMIGESSSKCHVETMEMENRNGNKMEMNSVDLLHPL